VSLLQNTIIVLARQTVSTKAQHHCREPLKTSNLASSRTNNMGAYSSTLAAVVFLHGFAQGMRDATKIAGGLGPSENAVHCCAFSCYPTSFFMTACFFIDTIMETACVLQLNTATHLAGDGARNAHSNALEMVLATTEIPIARWRVVG